MAKIGFKRDPEEIAQEKETGEREWRLRTPMIQKVENLTRIPKTVKELVAKIESGEDLTVPLPSPQTKLLPKLSEAYSVGLMYEGSRRGRPPKYTPRKLGVKVDAYFDKCTREGKPPTVTGLSIYLGIPRERFYQYLGHPKFGPIMMYARDRMENWLEEQLVTIKHNPTGIIFALKNRHGWKDVQTQEINYNNLTERELLAKLEALAPELVKNLVHLGAAAQLEDKPKVKVLDTTYSEVDDEDDD